MGCVWGGFKGTGVLWRALVTQVVAQGRLSFSGKVPFWGREGELVCPELHFGVSGLSDCCIWGQENTEMGGEC